MWINSATVTQEDSNLWFIYPGGRNTCLLHRICSGHMTHGVGGIWHWLFNRIQFYLPRCIVWCSDEETHSFLQTLNLTANVKCVERVQTGSSSTSAPFSISSVNTSGKVFWRMCYCRRCCGQRCRLFLLRQLLVQRCVTQEPWKTRMKKDDDDGVEDEDESGWKHWAQAKTGLEAKAEDTL